uniref:Immunoglobulin V-set domain-containing protein n=1 Tax=Astyanax mexicanus TaxID=7994 RepID=A0A8B9KKB8_ASTMX
MVQCSTAALANELGHGWEKTQGSIRERLSTYVAGSKRSKDTYAGTKGSTLEIYCDYPEGYQDYVKYFCRDPCADDDILIKSDNSISKRRYTLLDNVSNRNFIITIKNLIVEDFGVYHCGVEKSGTDILTKVKLFISGGELFFITFSYFLSKSIETVRSIPFFNRLKTFGFHIKRESHHWCI